MDGQKEVNFDPGNNLVLSSCEFKYQFLKKY